MTDSAGSDRDLLRHTVATLAYRAEKVLRDVPADATELRASDATRTPLEIVGHLADLMEWGTRMARGDRTWAAGPATNWAEACDRFFHGLQALDEALATSDFANYSAFVIFQGPVADALTHVGQLAMLRGIAGTPVRPESFARAEIRTGRVGREQSATRHEFDGDASRAKR